MKKTISFDIDEEVLGRAEAVYCALGLDTEMALTMFIRRTANEGKLPFGESIVAVPTVASPQTTGETKETLTPQGRTNTSITKDMVDRVWDEFIVLSRSGGNVNAAAGRVAEETGMNSGSAFIYLTILDNLVKGQHNTRNMKMKDLSYLVTRIKDELGEPAYGNARKSLAASLPYWDKPQFGSFAKRVEEFLSKN